MHLPYLGKALAGHKIEIQKYHPGINFHDQTADLIILSGGGGEGLEIHDEYQPGRLWYEDEMNLIRTTDKPILGICMGFEVIARAYGAPITAARGLVLGREELQVSHAAQSQFGRTISQYEAHSWRVEDVPSDFEVLAKSRNGIEIFKYQEQATSGQTKKIFATQFHPEKGGTLELKKLLKFATD